LENYDIIDVEKFGNVIMIILVIGGLFCE